MNKKINKIDAEAGFFEYKMGRAMAENFWQNRKSGDSKLSPEEYLRQVVNDNFGLKGLCTKVIVY